MPQHVVFAEVSMDEMTLLIQGLHHLHTHVNINSVYFLFLSLSLKLC